jgi:glycosyltransferase involved in cell wall biosynthesis
VKAFFWAADQAGCGQYRAGYPAAGLRELGHEAVASLLLRPQMLGLDRIEEADILIGQRVSKPEVSKTWQGLAGKVPLVYEIDDDLLGVERGNRVAWDYYTQPQVRADMIQNMRVADAITVTNAHLAEIMSAYNPNVFITANWVPESLLSHALPSNDRLTLGWAGSSSHVVDFKSTARPIGNWLRRHPEADLVIGGHDFRAELGRPDAKLLPWTDDFDGYYRSLTWDIGVVPLKDTTFNRSKSPIKFLEQAALGIPVVASKVGPYVDAIEDGVTGLHVSNSADWWSCLKSLSSDKGLRDHLSANARSWAATQTVEANAWRIEKLFQIIRSGSNASVQVPADH